MIYICAVICNYACLTNENIFIAYSFIKTFAFLYTSVWRASYFVVLAGLLHAGELKC